MRAIFPEAKHEAIDLKKTKDPKAREAQADRELDRMARRAELSGTAHEGHALLVTKVAGDRVHYTNPWGREESMSRADGPGERSSVRLLQPVGLGAQSRAQRPSRRARTAWFSGASNTSLSPMCVSKPEAAARKRATLPSSPNSRPMAEMRS